MLSVPFKHDACLEDVDFRHRRGLDKPLVLSLADGRWALFGFEQRIEIYKPASRRRYGYYCLPVLAGERLIGRVDLKARRGEGKLDVLATHFERTEPGPRDRHALGRALERFSASVGLQLRGSRGSSSWRGCGGAR